jgi:hypothetical protein
VPETCGHVRAWEANPADATAFTPTVTSYYVDQIPSMVPGIVLGAVSLVGLILMLLWVGQPSLPCLTLAWLPDELWERCRN